MPNISLTHVCSFLSLAGASRLGPQRTGRASVARVVTLLYRMEDNTFFPLVLPGYFCPVPVDILQMIKCGCASCLCFPVDVPVCFPRRLSCYMLCICYAEAECNSVHTRSNNRAMMNIKMMMMMMANTSDGTSNMHLHVFCNFLYILLLILIFTLRPVSIIITERCMMKLWMTI